MDMLFYFLDPEAVYATKYFTTSKYLLRKKTAHIKNV